MFYYAVARFDTKKQAEQFAYSVKNAQINIVDEATYCHAAIVDALCMVIEVDELSEETTSKIDTNKLVDDVAEYLYDANLYDQVRTAIEQQVGAYYK